MGTSAIGRGAVLGLVVVAIAIAALTGTSAAQPAPGKLTIGIYAPTMEFTAAQARLAYVQGLAKAVEQTTGIRTEARSYANLNALKKDNVDFAIVDGACYATNLGWRLLAIANIGGATRMWALYASANGSMQALKGKKLAFIATGCNDAGFIDNAMLDSEVDPGFFGARVGKPDLIGAVAEVASYKTAQAVFAPIGSAKGLVKVFDTGLVPNPALVALTDKLPKAVVDQVASAATSYGGGTTIAGWSRGSREIYTSFASRFRRLVKAGVFAAAEPLRLDASDAVVEPTTFGHSGHIDVRHLLARPRGARLE